jgi:hypothetical protein
MDRQQLSTTASRCALARSCARRATIQLIAVVMTVAWQLLSPAAAAAQTGRLEVRLSAAGAPVPDALIRVAQLPDTVPAGEAATSGDGAAVFTLRAGRYLVTAQHLGYAPAAAEAVVRAGVTTQTLLATRITALDVPGVIVEAERRRGRFEHTVGTTVLDLTSRDLRLLPALGEPDVLRAVEVLPGVVSTSDFSSSFNVRGGAADQNLILLDGLPLYNPFHLGGLFSVFNSDMIAGAELLAGGFPARYGGRVSSVLAVTSDAGESGPAVQAGVSVLASRVAVGADLPPALLPGQLETGRARVSFRRSYFDQLLQPFFDFPYHLRDAQLYAEAWTAGGGRLTVSGYTGRDQLDLAGVDSFPLKVRWGWGNDVLGAAWVAPLGAGLLEVRAGHTRFATAISFPEFGDTEFRSRITQSLLRVEALLPAGTVQFDAGAAVDRLLYDNLAESGGTVFGRGHDVGWLIGAYGHAEWSPGAWRVQAGVRADGWLPGAGGPLASVQPRLAMKYFLSDNLAVKGAAGRYAQFMHSLRDEELPLGIDIWVLSGERAPVVVSDQAQIGMEGFFGSWFAGLELFHRQFDGVTATNTAEDPNDPLDDLLRGTGRSWGADLQLRRDRGRLRPMLAISWLRATRAFPSVPLSYPPIFDRRLDIDLVLQAELPAAIEMGARWNYGSSLPYTRPLGAYVYYDYSLLDGARRTPDTDKEDSAVVLGARNAERYPAYHRLDLSVRRTFDRSWGTLTPFLDVLNVYDRRNVLFYFYQYDRDPPTRAGLSMFPVLPTAGLEVRF